MVQIYGLFLKSQHFAQNIFNLFQTLTFVKNILRKTCECGANGRTFAGMGKERKTIKVESAAGGWYYRRIPEPTTPPRGQRYTMLRNRAVIRLELTSEQYQQAKDAENAVGRAGGANVTLTMPDVIIGAVTASLCALQGDTLHIVGSTYAPLKKAPGRPARTGKGKVIVMLNVSEDIPLRLSKHYDDYCKLEGVDAFPASGPIWTAFRHGVKVIREALGEG